MAATEVKVQMQQRRDTAANWTSANPTLLNGELAYETDTGKWKLGDGSTAWSSLAYTPWGQISFPITTADIADDAVTGAKLANNIDIAGTLDVTSAATFDNNVTIQGDLTVNGTTTTIDTTTLVVEDKNIEMGAVSTPTDSTADGGGITLKGATDKTLNWVNSTDCWTFNQALDLTAGTAGAPALVFNSDVNTGLFQPGADSLAIATGGTQRVTVDSSGNVGIGTSPSSKLHVDHDINAEAYTIIENSRNYGFGVGIDFKQPFANAGSSIVGGRIRSDYESDSNSFFAFSTLQSGSLGEKLRIDSSGNTGIGVTSPSSKLHVKGTADSYVTLEAGTTDGNDGILFKNSGGTQKGALLYDTDDNYLLFNVNSGERLRIDSSGRMLLGTTNAVAFGSRQVLAVANGTTGGVLSLYNSTTATANPRISSNPTGSEINNIGIHAASTNGSIIAYTNNDTERLRIDSAGDVQARRARSNTAGDVALSVQPSDSTIHYGFRIDAANNSLNLDRADNNSTFLTLDSNGNVGIGKSSDLFYRLTFAEGSGDASRIGWVSGSGNRKASIDCGNTAALVFRTDVSDTERMRIDSSGYVGIGETSPSSYDSGARNLVVSSASHTGILIKAGSSSYSNLYFGDGTGSASYRGFVAYNHNGDSLRFGSAGLERMRIDSSGNVGIGTSSPANRLTVIDRTTPIALKIGENDNATTEAGLEIQARNTANTSAYSLQIAVDADAPAATFDFAGSERLRIDSSGRLLVGATSLFSSANCDDLQVGNTSTAATGITIGSSTQGQIAFADAGDSRAGLIHYQHTDNSMRFFTTGAANERMRIDSSGRLLVGTSSSSVGNTAVFQGNSSGATFGAILNLARGSTSISDGGELGILSFSDSGHDRAAEISAARDGGTWTSNSSQPTRLVFSTTANGSSSPTERMRIGNNGTAGFFGTNATVKIGTAAGADTGSANALLSGRFGATSTTGGGTDCIFITSNGDIYNSTQTYGQLSDQKLKENIVDANSQWDNIKGVRVRNFNFIEGQTHTQIGVIAQELEVVSPGLVSESPDVDAEGKDLGTVTKSVKYSVLYMKAVKALQEAMERIETLEQRLSDAGIA